MTTGWPDLLATLGLIDPAARQATLLTAQAAAWLDTQPSHPVWLAGILAATGAETTLARAVASLPQGRVILPALDLTLDELSWAAITDTHPQAGLKRLLDDLGIMRQEVVGLCPTPRWGQRPQTRPTLIQRALLPAPSIARAWREPSPALDTTGLSTIPAPDEAAEALAIALALRATLEQPGQTAALVTPDRRLARRVAAELGRFGVLADDSAGEPLAETPGGVLVRLLAACAVDGWPPSTLLALLKHPFTTLGLSRAACRAETRRLERTCLRGPRPLPGPEGLRRTLAASRLPDSHPDRTDLARFIGRLAEALTPLTTNLAAPRLPPATLLESLLDTAERVADPALLWSGEEGETLAAHLADLTEALAPLPPIDPAGLPALLDATFAGAVVHGRRALRAADASELHPRISIWGLLEARGQTADLLILGGLTEGTWPAATDPGPWMSRPMRAAVGLPSPEQQVGAAALDFATLACAAPEVILTWSRRRDRAPAVPSRWIARLDACLAGQGRTLIVHPALAWAAALDHPEGAPKPAAPPQPRPPVASRPRRLTVTEIETWLRDPYAIYARRILHLHPLADIEEEADRALFGNVVHDALKDAFRAPPPFDAPSLNAHFESALARLAVRPAVAAWWRPRLARIATWIADQEAARTQALLIRTEIDGQTTLTGPAGPFILAGRADRIERRPEGLSLLDYKTGTVPTEKAMREGWSPQLPLEATMAALGAFGPDFDGVPVTELAHWKLSGGATPGEAHALTADGLTPAAEKAWNGLRCRIEQFDDPATPYLAQPHPGQAPSYDRFATLARVAEWRTADE